jgi:hypothetical protein
MPRRLRDAVGDHSRGQADPTPSKGGVNIPYSTANRTGSGNGMKGQTSHTLGLVNILALRVVEQPPSARAAFIKAEVAKLRENLLEDAGSNPTMIAITNNFADRLAEWLPALAEMIEASDRGPAENG